MPSPTHQILIELFRRRPALMSDLLLAARKTSQPMVLPPGARVVPTMATFMDLTHAEYRPDLALHVLLAGSDEPMQTFIIEAQLRPDGDKGYTWPLYSAGLRARDRCPVTSIVLALDERTAEWARAPVVLDLLGTHVFRPVVIGPGDIPVITELGEARARPELALLSALVHCRTPGGEKAVYAALSAASAALDREFRALYARAIRALMSEEVRRPLEELMEFEGNQLDVEMFRYYYNQGEKAAHETWRALLIDQLTERFGALPEAARGQIQTASPEVLAGWARRVLSAASLDDVLASTT
jgi:uncharacterized protein (DUF2164 family)